jgi:hypothetical protein
VDEAQGKLTVSKKFLIARKEALRQQLSNITSLRDAQKMKLMGGDTLASFEGLEQKMQHHEKNIFHLRDFIDAKVLFGTVSFVPLSFVTFFPTCPPGTGVRLYFDAARCINAHRRHQRGALCPVQTLTSLLRAQMQ